MENKTTISSIKQRSTRYGGGGDTTCSQQKMSFNEENLSNPKLKFLPELKKELQHRGQIQEK